MAIVIALLRGVNVGGKSKIKMDALREVFQELGMRDVQTYIQSGNVVCRAQKLTASLNRKMEEAIEASFGFRPDVMLRSVEQLRSIAAANPFAEREGIEPNKLHVHFLRSLPEAGAEERLQQIPRKNEEIRLIGSEVFVYYPEGIGQSKITGSSFDRALRTSNTARNWNTVLQLLRMAETLQ